MPLINASAPGPRAAMVRGRGVTIHPSMADKARVRPRGYPKGATFADCKGCSTQVDGGPFTITEMVSARPKYSSSVNTWAHEATHGYDKAWGKAYGEWSSAQRYAATDTKWYGISGSPAWQRIHTATNWNNAYLASHSSESFAEGMAMYLEGGIQRAKLAPKAREFLARVANDTLEGKHLL